jgi:hypothetical protein
MSIQTTLRPAAVLGLCLAAALAAGCQSTTKTSANASDRTTVRNSSGMGAGATNNTNSTSGSTSATPGTTGSTTAPPGSSTSGTSGAASSTTGSTPSSGTTATH